MYILLGSGVCDVQGSGVCNIQGVRSGVLHNVQGSGACNIHNPEARFD